MFFHKMNGFEAWGPSLIAANYNMVGHDSIKSAADPFAFDRRRRRRPTTAVGFSLRPV